MGYNEINCDYFHLKSIKKPDLLGVFTKECNVPHGGFTKLELIFEILYVRHGIDAVNDWVEQSDDERLATKGESRWGVSHKAIERD